MLGLRLQIRVGGEMLSKGQLGPFVIPFFVQAARVP